MAVQTHEARRNKTISSELVLVCQGKGVTLPYKMECLPFIHFIHWLLERWKELLLLTLLLQLRTIPSPIHHFPLNPTCNPIFYFESICSWISTKTFALYTTRGLVWIWSLADAIKPILLCYWSRPGCAFGLLGLDWTQWSLWPTTLYSE